MPVILLVAASFGLFDTAGKHPVFGLMVEVGNGGRERCRADVLDAVRAAGHPPTRKEVIRALKTAGGDHGVGTVAKALADLTRSNELVNHKDKRGYRLPAWVRRHPGLFHDK